MCIPVEALLGGLLRRIKVDGVAPSAADLLALLKAGVRRSELDAALAKVGGPVAEEARRVLESVRCG